MGGEFLASLLLFGHVKADKDHFCWASYQYLVLNLENIEQLFQFP